MCVVVPVVWCGRVAVRIACSGKVLSSLHQCERSISTVADTRI